MPSKLKEVGGLLVSDNRIKLNDFVHLSFNGKLEGIWKPKLPDGMSGNKEYMTEDSLYPEPDWVRISVSSSVVGAFRAIYPNIYHYFEEEDYPYLDFYVYSPSGNSVGMMTPKELTDGRYVHDAHVTDEHVLLENIKMTLMGKIRVYNTVRDGDLMYRPFNDSKLKERFHSPKDVRYVEL